MSSRKNVTIYDIAREAEVSPATVSRILTGSARVRPEKRNRVLALMEQYDFHPNSAARALSEQRSHLLGMICPDVRNPYFASLFSECERIASARGYMLMLNNSFAEPKQETAFISRMLEQRCEAIILAGGVTDWLTLPEEYEQSMTRFAEQVPLVCTAPSPLPGVHQVLIDQEGAMQQALSYLTSLGHRRIAFLNGPLYCYQSVAHLESWKRLLEERGIPLREEYIVVATGFGDEEGYRAMKQLLQLRDIPTALISSNDMMAVGAMRAARESGFSLPNDLSVIGFDDSILSEICVPRLTSVRTDYAAYARMLVDTALALSDNRPMPACQKLGTTLTAKDSCSRMLLP